MDAERKRKIGDTMVEEFYWNRRMVVYVNNYKTQDSFEQACLKAEKEKLLPTSERGEYEFNV